MRLHVLKISHFADKKSKMVIKYIDTIGSKFYQLMENCKFLSDFLAKVVGSI